MKTIILFLIIFVAPHALKADYEIDFSNPMTYQTTCGSIQPSQWSVSGTTCELMLPPLVATTDSFRTINYLIRINQSGNLYKSDYLTVMYKHSLHDAWTIDTTIFGQINNNVRDISGNFTLYKGDTLYFKIIAYTRFTSGFWAVKSGDIAISGVTPVLFPLPVDLIRFDGMHDESTQSNVITWATASETNNARFVIERSENGMIYETLHTIPGAGNSNILLTYEYEDMKIEKNYYYRLTQVDFDGKSETFSPLYIERYSETNSSSLIENVWMNENNVHFTLNSTSDKPLDVSLYDAGGSLLHQTLIHPEAETVQSSVEYNGHTGSLLILVIKDSDGKRDTRKIITL